MSTKGTNRFPQDDNYFPNISPSNPIVLGLDAFGKMGEASLTDNFSWIGDNSDKPSQIYTTDVLSGKDVLVNGQCTVIDNRITTMSWGIVTMSTVGVSTSVPIKFTAESGQMVFSTSQPTDTGEFGYMIFL